MPGRKEIGNAANGEDTSLDGTEKIPVSGNKYILPSTIAAYIRTLVQTLTGKTINLTDNTLTGTTAQFNTALSDGNFATLTGSEALTNKTLTAPTIADFTNAQHDHGDADDGGSALASPTITTPTISGAIVFPDNTRQTFNPGANAAGLNVGSHAGDPGTPTNGDLWYDSVGNTLDARINGATVNLGAGGGAVATDTIWDAKGDVAGGTGANTAAVLTVGTNGQVLTADSGETTGLKWATPGAGTNVATDTLWDAKGDLAGGTGSNTAAKLTVGTNGHVLTADSGETTGLKWAAAAGGTALVSDKKTITAGDKTTTSTTFVDVDVTNMAITLTTGARRCLITVSATGKNSAGNANNTALDIDIDGARQGQAYGLVLSGVAAAATNFNLSFSYTTDVLTAASHTFKLQWRVDAGTGTLYASTGVTPLIMSVVELADTS